MKKILEPKLLPFLACGAGGAALVLQGLMMLLCRDEKGLLPHPNWLHLLAWCLVILALALTAAAVRPLKGHNRYAENFPASLPGAVGSFALALGIAICVIFFPEDTGDIPAMLWRVTGLASVPCLIFTGYCRMKGKRPAFYFHGMVFVFFVLHLVNRCRDWGSDPELAEYTFALFACVGLMLTAYYRAAFDCGIGRRRMQLLCALLCCCTCLAAVPGQQQFLLYLTGAVWAVTNLCDRNPGGQEC